MIVEKETSQITSVDQLPLILALNKGAEPLGWINYERCAFYYAKEKILWSLGQYEVVLRGGMNAKTGLQSKLVMDTIVAIDNEKSPFSYRRATPALSNKALFERDRNVCAYCGHTYKRHELTRDHIIPRSKGGADTWENLVAACRSCNSLKDDRTPAQAHMELLYVPYIPSYHESLILQNRKILADQMSYLMKGVNKNSRLHLH